MDNQLYLKLRNQGIKIYLNTIYPVLLKHRARQIGKKKKIEVVFFAMNLAMWRYQGIYDLLSKEKRFNCHIVFTVPKSFTREQQMTDLQQMRDYFNARGIHYVDHNENIPAGYDVKKHINPDILFYPQPYALFLDNHQYSLFPTKLLCYIPYGMSITNDDYWQYNVEFHNLAWKIFCPFQFDKESARKKARNRGRNWVVSGYYMLDTYNDKIATDVWKIKDRSFKRLIWAPHFTVAQVSWITARSNFLWMSQLMLDIAEQYKDKLQIAFKPHPRLKTELYKHPNWGKEKTDRYYNQWATMDNTQVETGAFVDLFMTSDAMIHDSGSFTVEYLFVNKPVAFVTKDVSLFSDEISELARDAMNQHYIVGDEVEVRSFIDEVVLDGKDTMAEQRSRYYETILRPNVSAGTTSQFIVDDIKKSLGID